MSGLVQKIEQTKTVYKRVTTAEAKTGTTVSQALATFVLLTQQSNYDSQPPNFPFTHFSILLTIFVCFGMREKKTIRRIGHGIILS